jgi:hypothetical protein
VRNGRRKRGQCWDRYSDRRLDDHECGAARLEPDAALEPIRQAGVVDNHGSARQVTYDGASVRIDMIVPVAHIVMLAVRLGLFLEPAVFTALRAHIRWIEVGDKEGGKQDARHSHGSSPCRGAAWTESASDR